MWGDPTIPVPYRVREDHKIPIPYKVWDDHKSHISSALVQLDISSHIATDR